MKTYKTYQECKIANPECEIYTDGVLFTAEIGTSLDTKCNPADYCMTVEEFLRAGHKFVEGDLIFSTFINKVMSVSNSEEVDFCYTVADANELTPSDNERFVLRAAALEQNHALRLSL